MAPSATDALLKMDGNFWLWACIQCAR